MTQYKIYRSIRINHVDKLDVENIGISWSASELQADKFSAQFGEDYIVVEAKVTVDIINVAQTNAQWENRDTAREEEVVIKERSSITITGWREGDVYDFTPCEIQGNVGTMNRGDHETRPNPIDCEDEYVTDYLDVCI